MTSTYTRYPAQEPKKKTTKKTKKNSPSVPAKPMTQEDIFSKLGVDRMFTK